LKVNSLGTRKVHLQEQLKEEKVDNSKFDMNIPEGYTEMTN
jgi:hypothetical protein